LLSNLQKGRIIKTPRVFEAMLAVDRALFVPGGHLSPAVAYQDAPHPIGHGATISAPHMHAMCLELLADRLVPGATALDVGSGSGYLVACMAEMVTPKKTMKASEQHEGKGGEVAGASAAASGGSAGAASSSAGPSVFGIEHIGALVAASKKSLAAWDPSYEQRIQVVQGDGRLGFPGHQYDAIHVGAAAATIPQALLDQLKPGGRLVIPVGPEGGDQHLDAIDKDLQGKVTRMRVTGVRYVPLTSEEHQVKNAL
jgi:protein-L-isoaspartate(D-aspartate) O-methyltransferase